MSEVLASQTPAYGRPGCVAADLRAAAEHAARTGFCVKRFHDACAAARRGSTAAMTTSACHHRRRRPRAGAARCAAAVRAQDPWHSSILRSPRAHGDRADCRCSAATRCSRTSRRRGAACERRRIGRSDGVARRRLSARQGGRLSLRHGRASSAVVSGSATLGEGVQVMAGCVIQKGAEHRRQQHRQYARLRSIMTAESARPCISRRA